MGMLDGRIAVQKIQDGDDGERFVVLYEKPELAGRNGYMFNSTDQLTEEELTESLVGVGATPFDVARILGEARANFQPTQ